MHDPMTVAFSIRRPWRDAPSKFWPAGYRPEWVTIWHVDPEVGGDENSCGFTFPHPPDALVKELRSDLRLLNCERADTYKEEETGDEVRRRLANVDPEGRYTREQREAEGRVAWELLWLNRASFYDRQRPLSPREVASYLYGSSFPGNRDDDSWPVKDCDRLAWIIARVYCQLVRPWWRHPRWHFHHWRIQIHHVQSFKRWAFSRCCRCGGRFRFGESPITGSWSGVGPRWFRAEPNVWHQACDRAGVKSPEVAR